jgi:hypothetical protein
VEPREHWLWQRSQGPALAAGAVRRAWQGAHAADRTATCAGKLTLTVKSKGKHAKKAKAETIGTAAFAIPAGKTGIVTITLTAAGRALLKAGHGKLSASLTIVKSSPSPTSTQYKTVQLVQKAAKAKQRPR